jgi:hypothetical protein
MKRIKRISVLNTAVIITIVQFVARMLSTFYTYVGAIRSGAERSIISALNSSLIDALILSVYYFATAVIILLLYNFIASKGLGIKIEME